MEPTLSHSLYTFLSPYVAEIMQGAAILGIAGLAKMLSTRFAENEKDHKTILAHLGVLNGRMGKVEVWTAEHEKLDTVVKQDHEKMTEQCQNWNRREFSALWDRLGRRSTDPRITD